MANEPEVEEITDESDSDSNFDSDSDSSWQSMSPITSEEEYSTEDDSDGDECSSESEMEEEADVNTLNLQESTATSRQPREEEPGALQQPTTTLTLYRLCGDNIDKTVRHRYMRCDSQGTISLHYFHSYAVADRIDFSKLSDQSSVKDLEKEAKALLMLPSLEDEEALRQNFKILISRILCDNVPFFKASFDGVVVWHIRHEYYEEMSKKSETVSSV